MSLDHGLANSLLFFLNIRSLRCHHEHLQNLLLDTGEKPAIIALAETWLTERDPLAIYKLEGYAPIITKNRKTRGGGCAFYVKENIVFTEVVTDSNVEHSAITAKIDGSYKTFCVIFNPPNASLTTFMEDLDKLLGQLKYTKTELILCGDFNIDLLSTTIQTSAYKNLLKSYNLEVQNLEPTRIGMKKQTCIDHICTEWQYATNTIQCCISDHFGLSLQKSSSCNKTTPKKTWSRSFKHLKSTDAQLKFLFLLKQKVDKIHTLHSRMVIDKKN